MKTRSYMLDELGDPDAPAGSRLWALYTTNEMRKMAYDAQQLLTRLHNYAAALEEHGGIEALGCATKEECYRKYVRCTPEQMEQLTNKRL